MIEHEAFCSLILLYLSQMVKNIFHNHDLHHTINKITHLIIFLCSSLLQNYIKIKLRVAPLNFYVTMERFQEEEVYGLHQHNIFIKIFFDVDNEVTSL
jgi:hypothetical protein